MKKLMLTIPDEIHMRIKIESARSNVPMSGYIFRAVLERLILDEGNEKKSGTLDEG